MKKIAIIVILILISIGGCIQNGVIKEVKVLKEENDSLQKRIVELNHKIVFLCDELKQREDEISFLGHTCDSLKNKR